jgi:hypothetical protein
LRTIEDMYGLPYAGAAATATPITDCWTTSPSPVVVTNPGNQSSPVNQAITPLQLSAGGGTPPYQWTATGLPPGLSISTSGVNSGTPTVIGTFTVTATAADTVGASGNTTFSWRIKRH